MRPAVARDLGAIERLCHELDPHDYGLSTWERWLRRGDCVNLVAVAGGRVVGCFHGRPIAPGQAFIQVLRVAPAVRRRGVGSALVRRLEQELAGRGLGWARCTTGLDNRPARRLFAGRGFSEGTEVHRFRRRGWRPRRRPAAQPREAAVELALAVGLRASRAAPSHFLRLYFEADRAALTEAAERGGLIADRRAAAMVERSDVDSLWVSALGAVDGDAHAMVRLIESLPAAVELTVDAPADLSPGLSKLGFAPPGPDDRYVLLEKRLPPAG